MLSQTAEYALRAAVCLAGASEQARTTRDISETTRVPSTYLSKILRNLHRAGVVTARRGPNGGFVLAGGPETITALDVIDAVDPLKRLDHCPLGLAEHEHALCPLHAALAAAASQIENTFRTTTLLDLLDGGTADPAACRFPGKSTAGPAGEPDKEGAR